MKDDLTDRIINPLRAVARRYSVMPEYATFAVAYVILLAVRQGRGFPLPELNDILSGAEALPKYVRTFIVDAVGGHWSDYQRVAGTFTEDDLADFFATEGTRLLMRAKRDATPHPVIDTLCLALLQIEKEDVLADLNSGIGRFVQRAWFDLWNTGGSDEGLSVTGYSIAPEFAAITYINCDVAGIGVKVVNDDPFMCGGIRYDKVMVIPPFGCEARDLRIKDVDRSIRSRFEDFPEIRLASADWLFAARAAAMLKPGGRAVAAVPMNALNGSQSEAYREFFVRNRMVEAVIAIPKGFLNGTQIAFALIVLHEGSDEIKFVNGEEYVKNAEGVTRSDDSKTLDLNALLADYRNLNDYEAVTTRSLDKVYANECTLVPDFYLGEDLAYVNSRPFGELVKAIRRGAKLSISEWRDFEGDSNSVVKKVAFKNFSDGLVDEILPGLSEVPPGAKEAVLETGDLLISRMGFPFKIAVVEHRAETLVADENVWIVRMGGNRTLAYYLRAYLESERGSKWLSRMSAGATLRTISAKNIEKIPVPDADGETLGAIAHELEKSTILVRENRKRLDDSLCAMKNVFNAFSKNGGL